MKIFENYYKRNFLDETTTLEIIKNIISPDVIAKIYAFAEKYDIKIDCADIYDDIVIMKKAAKFNKKINMSGKAGQYDPDTNTIILVLSELTVRLFLHEYIHKKSTKNNNYGILENDYFWALNEAITEKIACEILNLPRIEQMRHPYFSMFPAIEELCKVIQWETIINSYFNNDTNIYEDFFKEDTKNFLNYVRDLCEYDVYRNSINETSKLQTELLKSAIVDMIKKHHNS